MSPVFWLALLLGYLVGAGAAMVLLPPEVISPLYGPLALTTVVIVIGVMLMVARHYRRLDRPLVTAPPTGPRPPRGGRRVAGARPAQPRPESPEEQEHPARRRETTEASTAARWPIATRGEPPATLSADEVRQALLEERVRVAIRPLEATPSDPSAFHHAVARLCDVGGRPFTPERYRPTLARCGLLGVMDRTVIVHAARVLSRATGERQVKLVCGLEAASLSEAALAAALEQLADDVPELLSHLVLELDRQRPDRPGMRLMERLRALGAGFCLHRLTLQGLHAGAVAERGFDHVRVASGRGGCDPAAIEVLASAGLTVLRSGSEPAILVTPGGGLPTFGDQVASAA